ncbi:MAG: hypothetical protein E7162_00305 [Firmicutes bacterium]|nr:hypothetical protein [Bacillota bacterium]
MRGINLDDNIIKLGLDDKIIGIFKDNNINTIDDLWSLKRKDLKDMNFSSEQINHVIIKMQLKGIDLNRKKY